MRVPGSPFSGNMTPRIVQELEPMRPQSQLARLWPNSAARMTKETRRRPTVYPFPIGADHVLTVSPREYVVLDYPEIPFQPPARSHPRYLDRVLRHDRPESQLRNPQPLATSRPRRWRSAPGRPSDTSRTRARRACGQFRPGCL